MNILMTGATGYVGGVLAAALREAGHTVHELGRKASSGLRSHEKFLAHTLGDDIDAAALQGIDVLVHSAYDFTLHERDAIWRVNVEGAAKLFAAARVAKTHIVVLSSAAAFSGARSEYGKAKLAIEALAPEATIIRPALVYGKRAGGIVGSLRAIIARSRIVPLVGPRISTMLCHEQDLAAFVVKLVSEKKRGVYTAAASEKVRFGTLVHMLARAQGRKVVFIPTPAWLALVGLRTIELCGVYLRTRSDGLVGLMHQNPKLAGSDIGVPFRALSEAALKE